jgi:molybdate transport system substrate-binding protein
MRDIVGELGATFGRIEGVRIAAIYTRSGLVGDRVRDGERVDVAISTEAAIDALVREGKVVADTAAVVARSGIGVAVRAGTPRPDIGTAEAFARTLRAARSVAMADPATGSPSANYLVGLFDRLGLSAELSGKTRLIGAQDGHAVVVCDAVARGDAEIGLQQIAEIVPVQGVELAGPLPRELQHMTAFAAAAGPEAAEPQLARRFVGFLASGAAAAVIRANGMEPP